MTRSSGWNPQTFPAPAWICDMLQASVTPLETDQVTGAPSTVSVATRVSSRVGEEV